MYSHDNSEGSYFRMKTSLQVFNTPEFKSVRLHELLYDVDSIILTCIIMILYTIIIIIIHYLKLDNTACMCS